jgi:hypothetical protein
MLNSISFHNPNQNTPAEFALTTQQRTKPEASPKFRTGSQEDQFHRNHASVHFGSAMPPPGGGGGGEEDPLFSQSQASDQDDVPIPAQALFQPVISHQIPTYTRWRTLPAMHNKKKPDLLQRINRAQAKIRTGTAKRTAAENENIMDYWLGPPSDQQIDLAEYLLSIGTPQRKVAKETSIFYKWLVGLVATRPVGLNNPGLLDKISKAKEHRKNGDSIRVAAKKEGISPSWLIPPPIEKLTKAQQHMREGDTRVDAAKKEDIAEHWLAGVSTKLKQEAASESEGGQSSSTGLIKAVSRMEISPGRQRPHLSAKDALNYFKKYQTLNPEFNAQQHAEVMGHIASYAFSHPTQKEDALNQLSAYSAAYNKQFPAVEHRNRTLGDVSGPAPGPSELASGSHSNSESDNLDFSSVDMSQIIHPPVIEVLGQTMHAHYDESGQFLGYFESSPKP